MALVIYMIWCMLAVIAVRKELTEFVKELGHDYSLSRVSMFLMFMGIVMGLPFFVLMAINDRRRF